MDGQTIQARVYAGYAKAAKFLGLDYDVYRPNGANSPMAVGNKVSTVKAAFDSSHGFEFRQPNEYGDSTWYALISDPTTQAGDYLTSAKGTYFIAAKQALLPVMAIECARSVKVSRQVATTTVGAVAYSGVQAATETDILGAGGPSAYWPASILIGGRGQQTGTGLPADVKASGWRILLPPSVPVFLLAGDIVTDDMGRRFAIDAAEQTDLGWRIQAFEAHT